MKLTIKSCARCNQDHDALQFEPFEGPLQDSEYTHWALCPTNGQPVLLQVLSNLDTVQNEALIYFKQQIESANHACVGVGLGNPVVTELQRRVLHLEAAVDALQHYPLTVVQAEPAVAMRLLRAMADEDRQMRMSHLLTTLGEVFCTKCWHKLLANGCCYCENDD